MIDAYASSVNYWRHLRPLVEELRSRGRPVHVTSPTRFNPWGTPERVPFELRLVASWVDARQDSEARTVYVEHGAGQTYVEAINGYAGAPRLEHVELFLCPSEQVANRWLRAYPDKRAEVVGCPALDRHYPPRPRGRTNVAITSHWNCYVVPETKPALPEFRRGIEALANIASLSLIGHAHPRGAGRSRALFDRLGVRFVEDPDEVIDEADLLIADNTSLMYEAAAAGVAVLALNASWYRRDVDHGLRFWSHVPGLQCDDPDALVDAALTALTDPPEARRLRAAAITHAYAHVDGKATQRAVDAIEELL